MKKNKYVSTFFLLLLFLVSCTKDFESLNVNPNAQTTGESAYLLTSAQITAARAILDDYNAGLCKWVQYYTHRPEDNVAFWHKSGNDIDTYWNYYSFYVDILPNLKVIRDNCEKTPHRNYWALANIMEAWSYTYLVDMWGKVPYTHALHGTSPDSEDPDYYFPLFDDEDFIYKAMIQKLFFANDSIETSATTKYPIIAASDAYANGDLLMWKKFCNTLNLRLLLRMSDVDAAYAKPLFEMIVSNPAKYPVISSNDEDFGIVWIGGNKGPWENQIAMMYEESENTYPVSTGVLYYLATMNDPRLPVLVDPAKDYVKAGNPKYVGCPPAFIRINPSGFIRMGRDSISNISVATFADPNRKEPIITYAELQFILAEAALKSWNVPSSAKQYYESGINASMEKYNVPIGGYLAEPKVNYDLSTNKLETIILQRYLAQFGQGANTFAMMRRTGYPALDFFKIDEDDVKGFPYRVKYTELIQENPGFIKSNAGVGIISDMWGKKLWWATGAPEVQMFNQTIQTGPVVWPVN